MSSSSPLPPLHGLKVLELARILAGPWAGQLLADMGADVVKVERPHSGDDTRRFGPPFVPAAAEGHLSAAYFHACNRGKRSIAVDFETKEGQAIVRTLAANADVIVENFKAGALRKFGLDYLSLSEVNPRLIYCSVTGFGQTGPYAERAGYDFIIQGMGGFMDITGDPEGEPMKAGVAFADIFTGLYATIGILAALRRRDETGVGAEIDMALLDTQAGVLANQAMNYLVSGQTPTRLGNTHPNLVPYQVFPVADGAVIVAVGSNSQFRKFCSVIGAAGLADDPLYATNEVRVAHRDRLVPLLAALTSRMTRAALLDGLERHGVPAGPINSIKQVFNDPQIVARRMKIDIPCPEAKGGSIPAVRAPIVMDGKPMVAERPAPALGAHTEEVLADPGWTGKAGEDT